MLRLLVRLILNLVYNIKLVNFERLQELKNNGPTLVIPNHVSFLDSIVMYALMPKGTYFVVYSSYASAFNWILTLGCNFVGVDTRNPYAMKKVMSKLHGNQTVVIFPEGRLTTTGSFMKAYSGVVWLASKSQANLVPMVWLGMEQSKFTRVTSQYRTRWFHDITLYVGKPYRIPKMENNEINQKKRFYSDKIIETMQSLKVEARLQSVGDKVNLFNLVLDSGKHHGKSKIVIRDIMGAALSYKKLVLSARIIGSKLADKLGEENTVGILLPTAAATPVVILGLMAEGKTIALLNYTAGIANNQACIDNAHLKTVVTSKAFIEKGKMESLEAAILERCRIVYLEDIKAELRLMDKLSALIKAMAWVRAPYNPDQKIILFTSGSESKPKGVVLSHRAIFANVCQGMCSFDLTPADNMLNAMPIFHSFGMTAGMFLPILEGMMVMLYPSPLHYKEIPEVCYDWNISVLLGTSTFFNGYAQYAHPYDFNAIKYVISGAEKLTDAARYAWMDKFGIRICEGYGMTEAAPIVSANTRLFYRNGCAGKLFPLMDYKLAPVEGVEPQAPDEEIGSLCLSGPNLMDGYLINGEFQPLEGYYDTGDVVAINPERYISIRSRVKRFAKISGEMVSLDTVEKAFALCFPDALYGAVNVQDAKRGEKIIIFTTARDTERKKMREYWQQNGLNMLSMPEQVITVDDMPLLGTGKTDYVTLKEMAGKLE